MKWLQIAAVAALMTGTVGAGAPISLPMTSLSLDVKNVAAGRQASNSFVTDWGSYDKTFTRQREISITVRNISSNAVGPITARVYWVGKAAVGNDRRMLKQSEKALDAGSRFSTEWSESSGTVTGTDMNLNMIGVRRTSGSRIDGWVVTLEGAGGKLLAVKASAPYLDTMARTPGALAALPQEK